ncbi:hypothetical protein HKX48_006298 [Thoreauomyces humboldtii]|nr:hypothetical protein HKX48_006298 [Thoreauomyces humboldtii]
MVAQVDTRLNALSIPSVSWRRDHNHHPSDRSIAPDKDPRQRLSLLINSYLSASPTTDIHPWSPVSPAPCSGSPADALVMPTPTCPTSALAFVPVSPKSPDSLHCEQKVRDHPWRHLGREDSPSFPSAKTIDVHLALSYLYEKEFRRTVELAAAALVFRPTTHEEIGPVPPTTHAQAFVDEHLAPSYRHQEACERQLVVQDAQTDVDEHLELSYVHQEAFQRQLLARDAQTDVDEHLKLSYVLQGAFQRQLLAPDAQTDVDEHLKLSYVHQEAFERQCAAQDAQTDVDEHLELSYRHQEAFERRLAVQDAQTDVDEHLELSYRHQEAFEWQLLAQDAQMDVDEHLRLSYVIQAAFERQLAVQDAQMHVNEHLALSCVCQEAFERELAHQHAQTDADEHLAMSYVHQAAFEKQLAAQDSQKDVDAHLALSYSQQVAFEEQLTFAAESRTVVDEHFALCPTAFGISSQADVDHHLALSYIHQAAFEKRVASIGAQEDVDHHLALSHIQQDAFERELISAPFQADVLPPVLKTVPELDAASSEAQGTIDDHLALSYTYQLAFESQRSIDDHLHLSYILESRFLYDGIIAAASASVPSFEVVDETEGTQLTQAVVDEHLVMSYLYEARFVMAGQETERIGRRRKSKKKEMRKRSVVVVKVPDEEETVRAHLLQSYVLETAFLRDGMERDEKARLEEERRRMAQAVLDEHLIMSYEFEAEFLRRERRIEEREEEEEREKDLVMTSNASESITSAVDADPVLKDIAHYVDAWTVELRHLTKLACDLRSGRNDSVASFLATQASDETVRTIRSRLVDRWSDTGSIDPTWIEELIDIMGMEIRQLQPIGGAEVDEPSQPTVDRGVQTSHSSQDSQYPAFSEPGPEAQSTDASNLSSLTPLLASTLALLNLPSATTTDVQKFTPSDDFFLTNLPTLLAHIPSLLATHRDRLAARDAYLADTFAASAAAVQDLQARNEDLEAVVRELEEDLVCERRGRRCVERELVRLEGQRRVSVR